MRIKPDIEEMAWTGGGRRLPVILEKGNFKSSHLLSTVLGLPAYYLFNPPNSSNEVTLLPSFADKGTEV